MSTQPFSERRLIIDMAIALQDVRPEIAPGVIVGPYLVREDGATEVEVNVYHPSGEVDGAVGSYTLVLRLTKRD